MPRRLMTALALVAGAGSLAAWDRAPAPIAIRVVKSPLCGCCGAWVDYLKARGFRVTVESQDEFTALKRANGVTRTLESCHTAFVGGYVIEGHVPAELVKQLLADRPAGIKGLSVPGMPVGSPGMDGPVPERYIVYSFDARGKPSVYAQR